MLLREYIRRFAQSRLETLRTVDASVNRISAECPNGSRAAGFAVLPEHVSLRLGLLRLCVCFLERNEELDGFPRCLSGQIAFRTSAVRCGCVTAVKMCAK